MAEAFSWIVTVLGLLGFWLAGKKVWWSWYVNIVNQLAWVVFAVVTDYYAFLVGTAFYFVVFVRNAYLWTKDHFDEGDRIFEEELAKQPPLSANFFECGHMSKYWGYACIRPAGHYEYGKSLHGYAGIFWLHDEGHYPDHLKGRAISPLEDVDVNYDAHDYKWEIPTYERNENREI